MKTIPKIHRIVMIVVFALFAAGCSGTTHWKEEVQLSDGRVIVVERETLHESGGDEWAFNRSGTKPKEYRIRFAHPDGSGKMVEWHSMKESPRRWPESPLILDFESGYLIVFSTVAISSVCEVYSKYEYANGTWIEEVLPDKFEARKTNLLIREDFDMPRFVTLETKRKVHADVRSRPEYLRVGPARQICG